STSVLTPSFGSASRTKAQNRSRSFRSGTLKSKARMGRSAQSAAVGVVLGCSVARAGDPAAARAKAAPPSVKKSRRLMEEFMFILSPDGTTDNSPPFQRWENEASIRVPEGRKRSGSVAPSGLESIFGIEHSFKTDGYLIFRHRPLKSKHKRILTGRDSGIGDLDHRGSIRPCFPF